MTRQIKEYRIHNSYKYVKISLTMHTLFPTVHSKIFDPGLIFRYKTVQF